MASFDWCDGDCPLDPLLTIGDISTTYWTWRHLHADDGATWLVAGAKEPFGTKRSKTKWYGLYQLWGEETELGQAENWEHDTWASLVKQLEKELVDAAG